MDTISVKYRNKSVFRSWLLSYIIILIIVLLLNAFVYMKSVSTIKDEVDKAHMASLEQLKNVLDTSLDDIERLTISMAFNAQVNSIVRYNQPLNGYYRSLIIKAINDIKAIKIANSEIDDFYIYFRHNDFILSARGKHSSQEFYDLHLKDYDIDYGQWKDIIEGRHFKDYIMTSNGESNSHIAFIHSIPVEHAKVSQGNIVVSMEEETLKRIIQDAQWMKEGNMFILDTQDNMLASTKAFKGNIALSCGDLEGNRGIFNTKVDGEDAIVSYITSEGRGWKYVSIVNNKVFFQQVKDIKRVVFVSISLCILVGGFMAYIFSKRNYSPVNRIISAIKSKSDLIEGDSHKNEMSFIEASMLRFIDEKEEVYTKINKQKLLLKDNFLLRLLKGQISLELIGTNCQNYDIDFVSEYFAVMLFYIEDYSNLFYEEDIQDIDEAMEIAHFVIANVSDEILNQSYSSWVIEADHTIAALINTDNLDANLERLANDIKEFIDDKFGMILSISISDVCIGLSNIPIAYTQAAEALEFNKIMGKGQITEYYTLNQQHTKLSKQQGYSLVEEQRLVNSIVVGNYRDAEQILEDLLDGMIEEISSVQMLKCRMFGLLNTMTLAMAQISTKWGEDFWEELNPTKKLLDCKTVTDIKERMKYILKQMDKYVEEYKTEQEEQLISDIVRIVQHNFNDENLNVSLIANRLNINLSYLSRIFKDEMGIGLLDYIHNVRINNAKKIMNERYDMTIKEVGDRVGYYNSVAFIRAFKRYEGMTPGQYKISIE